MNAPAETLRWTAPPLPSTDEKKSSIGVQPIEDLSLNSSYILTHKPVLLQDDQVTVFDPPQPPGVYGCIPAAWGIMTALLGGHEHLLPTVMNPKVWNARGFKRDGSRQLAGASFGKTPSAVGERGAHGLKDWTQRITTADDIAQWRKNPDLGILVRCNGPRVLDIDSERADVVDAMLALVQKHFGPERWSHTPIRHRSNSSRKSLMFKVDGRVPSKKVALRSDMLNTGDVDPGAGLFELLGDNKQSSWAGTHKSGARLLHNNLFAERGLPVLSAAEAVALWDDLVQTFAADPKSVTGFFDGKPGGHVEGMVVDDPVGQWLLAQGLVHEESGGKLHIDCAFQDQHESTPGVTNIGSASWLPAKVRADGTTVEGRPVCLHAGCKPDSDDRWGWMEKLGVPRELYRKPAAVQQPSMDQFTALPLPVNMASGGVPAPLTSLFSRGTESRYSSSGDGKGYTASRANIETALLADDMCHRVGFDRFKCEVMICEPGESKWRPLKETDAFNIATCLERRGFKSLPRETLRDAIQAVAERNSFDTAQAWLNGLQWDGVPRVGQFIAKGFGAAESAYATAIGDYVWSALAGRILEPGCKADMVPIAVGPQGCRKSSAVAAMSPKVEFFAELDLSLDESDLFRLMKGKLVLELGELAGMRRKEAEHLKRFVAATTNNWVEKWQTTATNYPRRSIFFGTTNEDSFLGDSTGSRRWLPFEAGACDPDWIAANRDQLFAEGAHLFRAHGVMFADAERLARDVHADFVNVDSWDDILGHWVEAPGFELQPPSAGPFRLLDALTKGICLRPEQINKAAEMRAADSLKRLGFKKVQRRVEGRPQTFYVKPG